MMGPIDRHSQIESGRWAFGTARYHRGRPGKIRRYAAELAALAPDVILAHGGSTVGPVVHATREVPIVFAVVIDPVGAGLCVSKIRFG
jgi:putative tryptophan/tyrosine transport system substrate-binding protein